jgi:hypothetical protein
MTEWLGHLFGRPCRQPVTGHEFVKATDPAWYGLHLCIWLAHPQASRCFKPRRCHDVPRT